MRVIARGAINQDGTVDMAWCDENGATTGQYQPMTNMQLVEDTLRRAGVWQYETKISDPDENGIREYEIIDQLGTVEARLYSAGEALVQARRAERDAMAYLRSVVTDAINAGCSESRAAKLARIDRQTVRRIIGKQ